jgi:hypothetical protein
MVKYRIVKTVKEAIGFALANKSMSVGRQTVGGWLRMIPYTQSRF